jgi:hypothetical protein
MNRVKRIVKESQSSFLELRAAFFNHFLPRLVPPSLYFPLPSPHPSHSYPDAIIIKVFLILGNLISKYRGFEVLTALIMSIVPFQVESPLRLIFMVTVVSKERIHFCS